jgi:hypothetical protein
MTVVLALDWDIVIVGVKKWGARRGWTQGICFEARRDKVEGNFEIRKSLIFNNHARGMSVANSPQSTTKHYRITQKSRNHLALLDWANHI